MYCNFTGHIDAFFLEVANDINSTFAGNMRNMYMCAGIFGNKTVAGNSNIFCYCRYTGHSDTCGNSTFMHVAFMSQFRFDSMGNQNLIKSTDIFGGKCKQTRTVDKVSVIRERHSAFFRHIDHFSQLFTFLAFADSTDNFYINITFTCSAFLNTGNNDGVINNRLGIRHTGDSRNTAGCCSHRTCYDILLSFQTRFTQMCMHVNQTWCYYKTISIIYFIGSSFNLCCNFFYYAVFYQHIHNGINILAGIDDTTVFNQCFQFAYPLSKSRIRVPYVLLHRFVLHHE